MSDEGVPGTDDQLGAALALVTVRLARAAELFAAGELDQDERDELADTLIGLALVLRGMWPLAGPGEGAPQP